MPKSRLASCRGGLLSGVCVCASAAHTTLRKIARGSICFRCSLPGGGFRTPTTRPSHFQRGGSIPPFQQAEARDESHGATEEFPPPGPEYLKNRIRSRGARSESSGAA